jgi:hypothetical protein
MGECQATGHLGDVQAQEQNQETRVLLPASLCTPAACLLIHEWMGVQDEAGRPRGDCHFCGVLMTERPKAGDKCAPASLSQAFPSILLHWAQVPGWHGAG